MGVTWELTSSMYGNLNEKLLKEGWKPFAVTLHEGSQHGPRIWFRRQSKPVVKNNPNKKPYIINKG